MTEPEPITIVAEPGVVLDADRRLPDDPVGTVVFAHGSGSSRRSPRNQAVARVLEGAGMETILLDLLTTSEDRADRITREHRFDIPLLSRRVVAAVEWARARADALPIGLFGSSTGAAAALVAAAERPRDVRAVVSRGGRPDLAGDALPRVAAPTLLIVGGNDLTVLDLNEQAVAQMVTEAQIEIVPGASHLFEEAGALETVSELAAGWFRSRLP